MKSIPALGYKNYTSDQNLIKRFAFTKYCRPKIDLVKEIFHLLNLNRATQQHKILDVGCGNGRDLIQIKKRYRFHGKLYGLDIAKGILAKAKELNSQEKTGINFISGNAENLNFSDNTFDSVIIKHVLHNIYDPIKVLQECRRILKPGGKLTVVVNDEKTRMFLRKLKPKLAQLLKIDSFPDADKHFNLEIAKSIFKKVFQKFRVFKFQSEIKLKNPKPYIDYIDSGRDFWGSTTDAQWQNVLNFASQYFKKIVAKNGLIQDRVTIGVIIAEKET